MVVAVPVRTSTHRVSGIPIDDSGMDDRGSRSDVVQCPGTQPDIGDGVS
jgi:hypothetical protein